MRCSRLSAMGVGYHRKRSYIYGMNKFNNNVDYLIDLINDSTPLPFTIEQLDIIKLTLQQARFDGYQFEKYNDDEYASEIIHHNNYTEYKNNKL